jgi:hypothetical protein
MLRLIEIDGKRSGVLHVVVAYTPSICFVATVYFGNDAQETKALRRWRDDYLLQRVWGRAQTAEAQRLAREWKPTTAAGSPAAKP